MARSLSLHHINALEIKALPFIECAAKAGASQISIFTFAPKLALPDQEAPVSFPLFDRSIEREAKVCLSDHGVAVVSMEFFPIAQNVPVTDYHAALATGRELGARRAVTHVHDSDPARAVDTLGRLCDLAASLDVTLGLEFMGLTPGCNSLTRAAWFVDQVGRANLGIGLDPLHIVRTGGDAAQITPLDARYFAYAQVCDGCGRHRSDNYISDALERLLPGDGDFPLQDIFAALPQATPLEIEAPSALRSREPAEADRFLAMLVERCQTFIDGVDPVR